MLVPILKNKQELDRNPPHVLAAEQKNLDTKISAEKTQRINSTNLLKKETDKAKNKADQIETKLQSEERVWRSGLSTLRTDLTKVEGKIPADVSSRVSGLQKELAKIEPKIELNVAQAKSSLGSDLSKVDKKVRMLDARSAKKTEVAKESDLHRIQKRVYAESLISESIGKSLSGNMHFYCADEAIEVTKVALDAATAENPVVLELVAVLESQDTQLKSFTAAATDIITCTAHGLSNWDKIKEVTTSGVLPAGLTASTIYYVVAIDDDTFKLTTDAPGTPTPTPVDITDAGTGNHSLHYVAVRKPHRWLNDAMVLSTSDNVTPAFAIDTTTPEDGQVRWSTNENQLSMWESGYGRLKVVFAVGTYELNTMTIHIQVASDDKIAGKTVTQMDIVITVV